MGRRQCRSRKKALYVEKEIRVRCKAWAPDALAAQALRLEE